MHKKRKNIQALIVGANGFIGRHLCQACLDASWCVDGAIHSKRDHVPRGVVTCTLDELDKKSCDYDVIIIATGNFRSTPKELLETNVIIPQRIMCRFPQSRIIYLSSIAVYGTHSDTITLQSDLCNPSGYGLSKIAGEFVVSTHKHGSSIRLSNVYGYGMDRDLFIAKAIEEAQTSGIVTLFGDGSRVQDYLYIQDAIRFIMKVALTPECGVFLGAFGASVSNKEIAEEICARIPESKIIFRGSDSSPSLRVDPKESFETLGFTCEYSLQRGLSDMISRYA